MEMARETKVGEILERAQETVRAVGMFTCYDFPGFDFRGPGGRILRCVGHRTREPTVLQGGGRLEEDLGMKAATANLKSLGDGVVEAVQEVGEAKVSAFGWTREEA